jgi:ubiquinone/menaquinone biosynthesis C-methylase UbiE
MDPESATEMARLMLQDQLITKGMGGSFPERPEGLPSDIRRILDIGCGPGGWVLDVAFEYPKVEVMGIDISRTMTEYAHAQAWTRGMNNASFLLRNILEPLDFPDGHFDLVNMRLAVAFMPRTAWPIALQECFRLVRPGGIIRLTESDALGATNNASFEKIHGWICQALSLAGYGFSVDQHDVCITPMLGKLLQNAGCRNMRMKSHALDFSTSAEFYASQYQNFRVGFKLIQPLLLRLKLTTAEEFDEVYNTLLAEALLEDFLGIWYLLTVYGEKPLA